MHIRVNLTGLADNPEYPAMNHNKQTETDQHYMRKCLELAGIGRGQVSPNPLVGSVLVRNNRVIGKGWHRKYGEPHAEVEAITNAGQSVEGATLYCNLEPCCHEKKQTPPCTPLIIQNKIARVVVANTDPNPLVSGKGLEQLRKAGIEVNTGVLEDEGAELNRFYFKYITRHQPYVSLKIAQTIDGKIGLDRNSQTWITGEEAAAFVHEQRSRYDAVLIGANTVRVDDPQLTVRRVGGRNPIRIILDGQLTSPPEATLFNDDQAPTWIFVSEDVPQERKELFQNRNVRFLALDAQENGWLNPECILYELGKLRISSILVEGGQEVFSQFVSRQLFDQIYILLHPVLFGRGLESMRYSENTVVKLHSVETLGIDLKLDYRNIHEKSQTRRSE